jgi:hypothetical protein
MALSQLFIEQYFNIHARWSSTRTFISKRSLTLFPQGITSGRPWPDNLWPPNQPEEIGHKPAELPAHGRLLGEGLSVYGGGVGP